MPASVTTLLRNAPFLVVMLPLAGAVLVGISASLGTLAARRTAQANALITTLLALAMASFYVVEYGGSASMSARVLPWSELSVVVGEPDEEGRVPTEFRGPAVRFAFSGDGLNVWFALVVCLAMFAVLQVGPDDGRWGAAYYALVLIWEACLLGAFLADDLLLFAVFSEASILPAFLTIGRWGGLERRPAAARWLVVRVLSAAFVVFGLVGLSVVSRGTGGTATGNRGAIAGGFVPSVDQNWLETWDVVGPWIVAALVVGFLLRAAVIPLHTWLVPVSLDAPAGSNLLLIAGSVNVGLYGLLRFVAPLVEVTIGTWTMTLAGVAIAGSLFASLLVLAQGNLLKFAACATLANVAACAAGVFADSGAGAVGSVIHAVHHAAAVGLLAYVVGRLNERFGTADVEAYGGLARRCPRLAGLLFVSILAIVGAPLTSGFVSRWLLLSGTFRTSPTFVVWFGVGTLILAWAGLWTLHRLLAGRLRLPVVVGREPPAVVDLDLGETTAALPLVAVVLWIGCVPSTFVGVTAASIPGAAEPDVAGTEPAVTPVVRTDEGQ